MVRVHGFEPWMLYAGGFKPPALTSWLYPYMVSMTGFEPVTLYAIGFEPIALTARLHRHCKVLPTGFEPVSQPRKGCMIVLYTTEAFVSNRFIVNRHQRIFLYGCIVGYLQFIQEIYQCFIEIFLLEGTVPLIPKDFFIGFGSFLQLFEYVVFCSVYEVFARIFHLYHLFKRLLRTFGTDFIIVEAWEYTVFHPFLGYHHIVFRIDVLGLTANIASYYLFSHQLVLR